MDGTPPTSITQAEYLSIDRVSMTFETRSGPLTAVADVSLGVAAGEFVALIGHSGCGKTTLLNMIAGLCIPTAGAIHCAGRPVTGPGPDRAVVFQNHSLLPWMTCAENVALGVEHVFKAAESKKQRAERVAAALARVHLSHAADQYPYEISGGMKQRVGIARALAIEPKLLLLDEPFGALDALTRSRLQDELMSIVAETRSTVVMVTHDIDEAILLADRIVMMRPSTTQSIGGLLRIELPRPRHRLELAKNARQVDYRLALLEFLHADDGHGQEANCA